MKLLITFGTRPEYIKVKSIIDHIECKTLFTGQHPDLIKIKPDYQIIIDNKTENRLNNVMANILLCDIFKDFDHILVQGDTSSALAVAIAAFHYQKKVIHLEAGLRTHDKTDPYPEELNRQLISRIATIHLCPTELNKINLNKEGIFDNIFIVGNTGLDNINKVGCLYSKKVLVTLHRRNNHDIMDQWFNIIEDIAQKYDLEFILPIHPNPNVTKHRHILKKVKVIDPIDHNELIALMKECRFIISDSGGIQEEASFLNKKIIVCRQSTERSEILGIKSNHGILCKNPNDLYSIVENLYNNYEINEECPFGDGKAWEKILNVLISA